ncbi:MAG: helix-turn-helix domain-containing protein [Faecalibacterium prausnitzii]|nr:helix-turn-helix domain-containing protein [Faecalibacterium prausnitzii]
MNLNRPDMTETVKFERMLAISLRSAYNLCNSTTEFRVLRVGGSIRVPKDGFDAWLNRAA